MFDILAFWADKEEDAHRDFPKLISKDWLTGVRATQVYYLHNPLRWGPARTMVAANKQHVGSLLPEATSVDDE